MSTMAICKRCKKEVNDFTMYHDLGRLAGKEIVVCESCRDAIIREWIVHNVAIVKGQESKK